MCAQHVRLNPKHILHSVAFIIAKKNIYFFFFIDLNKKVTAEVCYCTSYKIRKQVHLHTILWTNIQILKNSFMVRTCSLGFVWEKNLQQLNSTGEHRNYICTSTRRTRPCSRARSYQDSADMFPVLKMRLVLGTNNIFCQKGELIACSRIKHTVETASLQNF